MGYTTPADVWVSSDWADHKYRNPPSVEPGTDYATSYGTAIRLAGSGTVAAINRSNGGGTGRYVKVNLDDGRAVRYLHLSHVYCYEGQYLQQGELFAESGASGFGSDWGYGPHVHTTLLDSPWSNLRDSLDFENYIGENEDDDMNNEQDALLKNIAAFLYGGGTSLTDPNYFAEPGTIYNRILNLQGFLYAGGTSVADPAYTASPGTIYELLKSPVHRSTAATGTALPSDGSPVVITQIQDNADTNTLVRNIIPVVNAIAQELGIDGVVVPPPVEPPVEPEPPKA